MSTDGSAGWVRAAVAATRTRQEDFYRQVHQHPELSHQERTTAALIAERLRASGCEVHERVGGTGVVGFLRNGDGPSVLMRADIDALPVREQTGLPYASTATSTDGQGTEVPVMHACGHDVHLACLLGTATVLSGGKDSWRGTAVLLFQPAEELGDGAARMVDDGLVALLGDVDVALAQHVLPFPSGTVATRPGAVLSAADSMRVTVYGRGAHGSMPQSSVDPVVLASMIVIRLQTVVSREIAPAEPAVLTVGSIRGGTKSNVIDDHAVLELNLRTYSDQTRSRVLAAIRRIVIAECQASDSPREPQFELYDQFPPTINDSVVTARVREAFDREFGAQSQDLPLQSASEDFSDLPRALGVPYTYWGIGGADPAAYRAAVDAGRAEQDIPVNHSPYFAPVIQPTLDTGTRAMTTAALAWLSGT